MTSPLHTRLIFHSPSFHHYVIIFNLRPLVLIVFIMRIAPVVVRPKRGVGISSSIRPNITGTDVGFLYQKQLASPQIEIALLFLTFVINITFFMSEHR